MMVEVHEQQRCGWSVGWLGVDVRGVGRGDLQSSVISHDGTPTYLVRISVNDMGWRRAWMGETVPERWKASSCWPTISMRRRS